MFVYALLTVKMCKSKRFSLLLYKYMFLVFSKFFFSKSWHTLYNLTPNNVTLQQWYGLEKQFYVLPQLIIVVIV